jgi:L-rhamnose isomerase/sugar isomerase
MRIEKNRIADHNSSLLSGHKRKFEFATENISNVEQIIQKLIEFNVAIPSWALGTGGTRFGRFPGGGEPGTLEQKMEDVGLLHALNQSSGAISLHIPWDIPENYQEIKSLADSFDLKFDAVNSNTFQDQKDQVLSYKFGSLQHTNKAVRKQAIQHNIDVIKHGVALGSKALTVWLSDGS